MVSGILSSAWPIKNFGRRGIKPVTLSAASWSARACWPPSHRQHRRKRRVLLRREVSSHTDALREAQPRGLGRIVQLLAELGAREIERRAARPAAQREAQADPRRVEPGDGEHEADAPGGAA